MKDVIVYGVLFAVYAILALNWYHHDSGAEPALTWQHLAWYVILFTGVGALARWSVMAFKPRPERLLKGQKIVGIEEGEAEGVLEVIQPKILKRETKKPRLKRRP